MASGIPVVATPNPGAIEVLAGGRYGHIVEPAALGESLQSLLQDEPERGRLAKEGLERVQEYAWPRIVESYSAVYREFGCESVIGSPAFSR
jgi:glycosyltransferase involved in cell wall biosynthesis